MSAPADQPPESDQRRSSSDREVILDLTLQADDQPGFALLPASRGVACFEDAAGQTIAIATSADVRRLVRRRLTPGDSNSASTDLRSITRSVRAQACGSAFEADVEWLRLAQQRLPHAAKAAADRWQCWFVHIDADATHPWPTKTRQTRDARSGGTLLGLLPDKHAAGRFIEAINAVFDLCRYRHILLQAPDAVACAYKEMGRCPAPCDGSISLDNYRRRVREAISFAAGPVKPWIESREQHMQQLIENLDFERAAIIKRQLEDASVLTGAKYRWLTSPDDVRFVSVQQAVAEEHASVFLIRGGDVRRVGDVPVPLKPADGDALLDQLRSMGNASTDLASLDDAQQQMLGLVNHHLYLPPRLQRGAFARLSELDRATLSRLVRTAHGRWSKPTTSRAAEHAGSDDDDDRVIEAATPQ